MKRQQRRVDKTPDRGDLINRAGESSEHLGTGSSACSECGNQEVTACRDLWGWQTCHAATKWRIPEEVNDSPNNLQLVSNRAVEANDVPQRA